MNSVITLVNLAGAVALLLWGTHMVRTGMQRAFGPRLRSILASALKHRFSAFLAGLGVTAALQSSTATGLMATGLAAGGLVDLVPALAVMLGANVGSTLIVQVLSFNIADVFPGLILVGFLMFRKAGSSVVHDLGRVLIGLGLMLLSLHLLVDVMTPIENAPALKALVGAFAGSPILYIAAAAVLTWAAHSSVAVVLLVMSLASRGVVSTDAALALVLGANLGTAINPLLQGASGADPASRRLPLGNLVNRLAGIAVAVPLLPPLTRLVTSFQPDPGRAVADFHTAFNLAIATGFFPLLRPYAARLQHS